MVGKVPEAAGGELCALQALCLLLAGIMDGLQLFPLHGLRLQNTQQGHMEDAALFYRPPCKPQ